MEKVNIRTTAINWLRAHYPVESEAVFTSKYYTPQESWSNSRVWFFQIPMEDLNPKQMRFLHFLCENHLQGEEFIYLKVPVSFFLLNEESLEVDKKAKVMRIYLSAEAVDMFTEVRRGSKLNFTKYVKNNPLSL